MGRNNKNEHLEELLIQKDQEIAALETQVQAYIARTSILQNRLLSTLDTLDVIQSGQNNELDAMTQTNKRLKDKLLRYSAVVKMAELERDDMRDAVLKLVEKVELSNDYSMWPHSQIRLSSLADGPIFPSPVVQTSESDLLLHATTMIETLCRERDLEHKAHAQTRDLAEARLVSLAAQLSRREAELESFISGNHAVSTTIHPEHPRLAKKLIDEPLTSEQVISALDATLTRNKTLEVEIRGLFKRLDDACIAASSTNLDRPLSGGLQMWNEIQRSLKPITSAVPPQNSTLQKVQSTSVSRVPEEATVSEHPRPKDEEETLVLPDSYHQAIQDLECQIKTLGAKIDVFTEARRTITQSLQTDVQREDASYSVAGTRLEFLESENHLLRLSERSLRDELNATRISAQTRENELLTEIQSLQSNQQQVFEEANDDYNLLESNSGEMSMELATPLLPTRAMLDTNVLVSLPTHYSDPSSIPLPRSPDNHLTSSSPTLSQIILLDGNTHHERSDLASIEPDHLARALQPP